MANGDQKDSDGDRYGDVCDNCRYVYNPKQKMTDPMLYGEKCNTLAYIYSVIKSN